MRRRRGQAFIEAAVATLVLALLVLGTLDFTGAYWRCQGMQHAAEAGAEWAALRGVSSPAGTVGSSPDSSQVAAYVKSVAAGFEPTRITVHSEWPDGNNDPGSDVVVTATHPLPLTIGKRFFPSGCGAPAPECTGSAVRKILRH